MARRLGIRCTDCVRRFGGDEGLRKHRALVEDRIVCMTDAQLYGKGWTRDRDYVWHRPVGSTAKRSSAPVRPTLFEGDGGEAFEIRPTPVARLARLSDPITSALAARAIAPKTGSIKAALLAVYLDEPEGLTDEEAAARAGISLYSATKRCADLRNDGWITVVGERKGSSGQLRSVCRVVEARSA